MKKVLIAYGVLVVIVLILAFFRFNGSNFLSNFNIGGGASVTVNDQKYNVEVADEDQERQVGLSGRDSLGENNGMLFVFDEKGKYNFWMKNTLIPLDIIYINDNKIVHIVKNAQPAVEGKEAQIYQSPEDANYVLELNAGEADEHKFEVGNEVTFSGIN